MDAIGLLQSIFETTYQTVIATYPLPSSFFPFFVVGLIVIACVISCELVAFADAVYGVARRFARKVN